MNPIFDQQITLEQALDLQNKIKVGEMPDIEIYYQYYQTDDHHGNLSSYYLDRCYKDNNDAILLTRPDYATYILGNNPLPDGYGYPSKDLGSGLYNGIPYMFCFGDQSNWLSTGQVFNLKTTTITKWYEVAFPLTDLARVEAEADKPFADKYKEALAEPKPSMPTHFEPDWKEAKYKELEKQLQEATASADAKQDRIYELEATIDALNKMIYEAQKVNRALEIAFTVSKEMNIAYLEALKVFSERFDN